VVVSGVPHAASLLGARSLARWVSLLGAPGGGHPARRLHAALRGGAAATCVPQPSCKFSGEGASLSDARGVCHGWAAARPHGRRVAGQQSSRDRGRDKNGVSRQTTNPHVHTHTRDAHRHDTHESLRCRGTSWAHGTQGKLLRAVGAPRPASAAPTWQVHGVPSRFVGCCRHTLQANKVRCRCRCCSYWWWWW
jgi:hypothetical protein